ncbi:hypothetical protein KUCAC02_019491, partial [Chaenocephalus aceratus]
LEARGTIVVYLRPAGGGGNWIKLHLLTSCFRATDVHVSASHRRTLRWHWAAPRWDSTVYT